MPRGDRTGPGGFGPMTGRRAGYCAGYGMPGYMNPFGGRGFWGRGYFGGGRGRGYRHRFYATGLPGSMRYDYAPYYETPQPVTYFQPPFNKEEEVNYLKEQSNYFQKMLEDINNRLSDLEDVKENDIL